MQSEYLIEPTLEEAEQLKKIKYINPNYDLAVPVSTSYSVDAELFIKWRIGSPAGPSRSITAIIYDDKSTNAKIYDEHGVCGIDIFVKNDSMEIINKKNN